MLVSQLFQNHPDPPKGGEIGLETALDVSKSSETSLKKNSSEEFSESSSEEYGQIQLRLILTTVMVSALAVAITALVFDLNTASSLLVGSLFGVFYLRLLARSIGKLGKSSNKISKVQLLVPVLLVLIVSRLPQLELLPALLGFLLYKPSLILDFLLESLTRAKF